MDRLPTFLLRILTDATRPLQGREKVVIVVRRPYAYLAEELWRAFAGQAGVHITVDRRYGERRTRWEPIAFEQRRGNRRHPQEEIIEMALTS